MIESKVERSLLQLACRYHINENIISNKSPINDVSTGPERVLFKRFQNRWETINKKEYETNMSGRAEKYAIVAFCKEELEIKHLELLE